MRAAQLKNLGFLFLFAIVVSPFIDMFESGGCGGALLFGLVILAIALPVAWLILKSFDVVSSTSIGDGSSTSNGKHGSTPKTDTRAAPHKVFFSDTIDDEDMLKRSVLLVLEEGAVTSEARGSAEFLSRSSPQRAELVTKLMAIHDAAATAHTDDDPERAMKALHEMRHLYSEIRQSPSGVVPLDTMEMVGTFVRLVDEKLSATLHTNRARDYVTKAFQLKTEKSKIKFAVLAREEVAKARRRPNADSATLDAIMENIEHVLDGR